jgi:hypothetical protein
VGTLTDNGVAVALNQSVSVADINGGKLVFTPKTNVTGNALYLCQFRVQDDGGTANGGHDLDFTSKKLSVTIFNVNNSPG